MTGRRGLWGFRYDTPHPKINHYKMRFRFMSAKWNAATRYSAHPFTTKTGARVHFFCLNYPRIRGWYQARVHPSSSGNGKGDIFVVFAHHCASLRFHNPCRMKTTHKAPWCSAQQILFCIIHPYLPNTC